MLKSMIVFGALLGSAGAFACPNLTGTYADPANDLTLVIKQAQGDCSKISIDQNDGSGPAVLEINGLPQAVPGTTMKAIMTWDGDALIIGSDQMPNVRQKWSLTTTGDLQDEEDNLVGTDWKSVAVEVIKRASTN